MPASHACEARRRRKVKCDGVNPCSNCAISELHCLYRTTPRKRTGVTGRTPSQAEKRTARPRSSSSLDAAAVSIHGLQSATVPIALRPPLGDIHARPAAPVPSPGAESRADPGAGSCASAFTIFHYDSAHVRSSLITQVDALLGPDALLGVANDSHEPTLRDAAALSASDRNPPASASSLYEPQSQQQVSYLRKFTLITALCAYVTAVIPESRFSEQRVLLSKLFLASSRATLRLYEEYDLEHPDSTSLTIRMWYSATMQNRTGRHMRLYSEAAIQRDSPVESKLLRAIFWLLFLADKTSIALETRPPILVEQEVNRWCSLEERIFAGFHLKRRIWAAAADMVADIKSYSRQKSQGVVQPVDEDMHVARLAEAYPNFTSLVSQLPDWLRQPESTAMGADDESVASYQRICFWTQRSNILAVFHCMKLVILQKCIDNNIPSVMGLSDHSLGWVTRKIEISQDFLHELQIVPFICLKAQGETAVERIRRVGSVLLELIHHADNSTIEKTARAQFEQLLDLLAKLDSKASDVLAMGTGSLERLDDVNEYP